MHSILNVFICCLVTQLVDRITYSAFVSLTESFLTRVHQKQVGGSMNLLYSILPGMCPISTFYPYKMEIQRQTLLFTRCPVREAPEWRMICLNNYGIWTLEIVFPLSQSPNDAQHLAFVG